MHLFFSQRIPHFHRLLLVESGSREILNQLIPLLRAEHGEKLHIDLVTCFSGVPQGLNEAHSAVYRVYDFAGPEGRAKLYRLLQANRYDLIGIVCSAEPIMTKWKWALAYQVPAKLFLINENADYFWFDYRNWRLLLHVVLFRAGLTGANAVYTLTRLLLFPFTLAYLLLFAAAVHLQRKVRT